MIRRKLALESRIARLEKLLVKRESYDDDTAEEVATAVADWVRDMWNNDPSFSESALAYINGDDGGDWIMDECLDALEEQGFVFDNEDADYISDCLAAEMVGLLEAADEMAESLKRRVARLEAQLSQNRKFEVKGENLSVITLDAINDWAKSEFTDLDMCNDFVNGIYPYAYDDPEREEILDNLQDDLINKYGCNEDEVYTSRPMIDMELSGAVQRILDRADEEMAESRKRRCERCGKTRKLRR